MAFCPECGEKNEDKAIFCGNCGTNLSASPSTQPLSSSQPVQNTFQANQNQGYQNYQEPVGSRYQTGSAPRYDNIVERPTRLTVIIVLTWISIFFLGLFVLITFALGEAGIGLLLIGIGVLNIYIARGLAKGNNTARKVALGLYIIGFVLQIFSILTGSPPNLISLIYSAFVIHTLNYHEDTKLYFEQESEYY